MIIVLVFDVVVAWFFLHSFLLFLLILLPLSLNNQSEGSIFHSFFNDASEFDIFCVSIIWHVKFAHCSVWNVLNNLILPLPQPLRYQTKMNFHHSCKLETNRVSFISATLEWEQLTHINYVDSLGPMFYKLESIPLKLKLFCNRK